jgi:hypothetical protein
VILFIVNSFPVHELNLFVAICLCACVIFKYDCMAGVVVCFKLFRFYLTHHSFFHSAPYHPNNTPPSSSLPVPTLTHSIHTTHVMTHTACHTQLLDSLLSHKNRASLLLLASSAHSRHPASLSTGRQPVDEQQRSAGRFESQDRSVQQTC